MNEEFEEYLEEQKRLVEQDARLREWLNLTDAGLRLRCGEITAQEIRTVRAVLNAIASHNVVMSHARTESHTRPE